MKIFYQVVVLFIISLILFIECSKKENEKDNQTKEQITSNAKVNLTGIFSTLKVDRETGDLTGTEVKIDRNGSQYVATLTFGPEGREEKGNIEIKNDNVQIVYAGEYGIGKESINGKITAKGINGTLTLSNGKNIKIMLPRTESKKKAHKEITKNTSDDDKKSDKTEESIRKPGMFEETIKYVENVRSNGRQYKFRGDREFRYRINFKEPANKYIETDANRKIFEASLHMSSQDFWVDKDKAISKFEANARKLLENQNVTSLKVLYFHDRDLIYGNSPNMIKGRLVDVRTDRSDRPNKIHADHDGKFGPEYSAEIIIRDKNNKEHIILSDLWNANKAKQKVGNEISVIFFWKDMFIKNRKTLKVTQSEKKVVTEIRY